MEINRAWMDRWVDAINADAASANMGRGFDGSFTLAVGDARYTLHVRDGAVRGIAENGGPLEPSAFTLSAAPEVWVKFFDPNPPAMYHAFFAAVAVGNMQFEGDVRLLFQQMTTLSQWVTVGRALQGPTNTMPDPDWPETYQATGRYVNVTLDGARHKVFYFEAGEGVPVLLQHTAGNENRQWRHLLEDRELTERYRFIAYDLPSHGKSDPPYGRDFFAEDHLLTSDWVTRFVVGLADALALDRPVFLGCSIGGVIALHLAAKFPERFRGFIGLAGAIPTYGFFHDWWIDPGVNQRMMQAGMVDAVMAPGVSDWDRQINRMAQGSHPKAMRNDLYFWGEDNADPELAERIDAATTPVYLYAGEYDFTCPPAHVEQCAQRLGPHAHYETIEGVGHFPMSEDYVKFRPVLERTLAAIVEKDANRSHAA